MSSSIIVLVSVLAAGFLFLNGTRPPTALEPATRRVTNGRAGRRRTTDHVVAAARFRPGDTDDDTNIVIDTLRVLGLVRRQVDRPVVGRKAYVRWWERLRAAIVLAAIVVALGVALAAAVGVTVLGMGFLLEQAIS